MTFTPAFELYKKKTVYRYYHPRATCSSRLYFIPPLLSRVLRPGEHYSYKDAMHSRPDVSEAKQQKSLVVRRLPAANVVTMVISAEQLPILVYHLRVKECITSRVMKTHHAPPEHYKARDLSSTQQRRTLLGDGVFACTWYAQTGHEADT